MTVVEGTLVCLLVHDSGCLPKLWLYQTGQSIIFIIIISTLHTHTPLLGGLLYVSEWEGGPFHLVATYTNTHALVPPPPGAVYIAVLLVHVATHMHPCMGEFHFTVSFVLF